MGYRSMNVEMSPEYFERVTRGCSPKEAIKELIWNACDADATQIEVSFDFDGIRGAEEISDVYVSDNGHGINFENVRNLFGKYGSSLKSTRDKSPDGRIYHGKDGQGRYKSLAIGDCVEWETVYQETNGQYASFKIQIDAGSRMDIQISESPTILSSGHTKTIVHICRIQGKKTKGVSKLAEIEEMLPDLLSTFAPYLLAYHDITLKYDSMLINPANYIRRKQEKNIIYNENQLDAQKATAIAISWKNSSSGKIYICGPTGVVYDEVDSGSLKGISASLYLQSPYFENMKRQATLSLGNADPVYRFFLDTGRDFLKEFIQEDEEIEAASEIKRIKDEGIYPFHEDPTDEVAHAEQRVFDVLAAEVNRMIPQLKTSPKPTKKLTYRLMREAIKTNPSSIRTILEEVCRLTKQQQDDLADLLTRTHLPEIIDVAKTVSDRLAFLRVLEDMVYNDEIGKPIKERTQFHKILLKELWVFGEKYNLGTSDRSLKNVLYAHINLLGRQELIPDIPPEAVDDLTRIPDLCLFTQVCHGYEQYEHLVIELKRPVFTLTRKEVDQIDDYAQAVALNPLFDKEKTRWHFILLGQSFNDQVVMKLNNRTQGVGNYFNSEDGTYSISILKWSTIIQENKFKYEYLRKKLNEQLSDDPDFTHDFLLKKYSKLFSDDKKENAHGPTEEAAHSRR